jgi:hypothetical protein
LPTVQIPLKKIKSIQLQEHTTLTQMAFIRFVIGDSPGEVEYVKAVRDPYTLMIDKPNIPALQAFHAQLQKNLAEVRPIRTRA